MIKLHAQGKGVCEIVSKVHMSFSPVCALIKKYEDMLSSLIDGPSKETLALSLLADEKDPIHIICNLDLKIEDMNRIYPEYLKLVHNLTLVEISKKVGEEHFSQLVQLCNIMIEKNKKNLKI